MPSLHRPVFALLLLATVGLTGCESVPKRSPPPTDVYDTAHVDTRPVLLPGIMDTGRVTFSMRQVQGTAQVSFIVLKDGTVDEVSVIAPPSPAFADVATELAKSRRFRPATVRGAPVNCQMTLTFRFNMGRPDLFDLSLVGSGRPVPLTGVPPPPEP